MIINGILHIFRESYLRFFVPLEANILPTWELVCLFHSDWPD